MAMKEAAKVLSGYDLDCALDEGHRSTVIATMAPDRQALSFSRHGVQAQAPTCVFTDLVSAQIHIHVITRLGIGSYIAPIVTSEELWVERSNQDIFGTTEGELDLSADWCSLLDNRNKKNIEDANFTKILDHLFYLSEVHKND